MHRLLKFPGWPCLPPSRVPALALAALFSPIARAACDAPRTVLDLERALAEEDAALLAMDSDGFQAGVRKTREVVACLGERIPAPAAAAVHTREAMSALIDGREEAAVSWSRAALLAAPGETLDRALMPEGHPLRESQARAATLPPPELQPVPLGPGLVLEVNGAPSTGLPEGVPCIAQVEVAGVVRWSGVLEAGEPLPAGALVSPDNLMSNNNSIDPHVAPPPRGRALALSAGGAALGSAGLYALALLSERRFKAPGEIEDDLAALAAARRQANTLSVCSGALGVVALGFGVAATLEF